MVQIKKEKHNYVFPDFMGRAMSKLDLQVQLEASMLSTVLILCGLVLTTFYICFYVHTFPLWYKITVVINCIAGIGFLGSSLVTTFQAYQSYLNAVDFQKEL